MKINTNKVLILHDYFQVNGGAERLITVLHQKLSGSTLMIGYLSKNYIGDEFIKKNIFTLCNISFIPLLIQVILKFLIKIKKTDKFDIIIYSGIYSVLNVLHQKTGKKIYYCHTPPRFIFDKEDIYLDAFNVLLKPIMKVIFSVYRYFYVKSINQMDKVITNSNHMKNVIKKLLNVEANVVFPPIKQPSNKDESIGNYYLSFGRLEKYKRVDLIVKAFNEMPDKKLIVASGGSELSYLKKIANSNISFTNWLPDSQLENLIRKSISCLYIPQEEDFGMTAAEANSFGKPVIIANNGGLPEIIIDNKTGIHLPKDLTLENIKSAVIKLNKEKSAKMIDDCIKNAERFSEIKFINSIKNHII